jgi:hypothetical protein
MYVNEYMHKSTGKFEDNPTLHVQIPHPRHEGHNFHLLYMKQDEQQLVLSWLPAWTGDEFFHWKGPVIILVTDSAGVVRDFVEDDWVPLYRTMQL